LLAATTQYASSRGGRIEFPARRIKKCQALRCIIWIDHTLVWGESSPEAFIAVPGRSKTSRNVPDNELLGGIIASIQCFELKREELRVQTGLLASVALVKELPCDQFA
jgi:hypothetical protein